MSNERQGIVAANRAIAGRECWIQSNSEYQCRVVEPPILQIEVARASEVSDGVRGEIISLCDRAYGTPVEGYFWTMPNPTHVIGRLDSVIVSHAMWVTRWLQAGRAPVMRTAYVEMVATDPGFQHRGYAAAVMRRLAESITAFELGALCPSDAGGALYPGLGWQYWRGPLYIRGPQALIATPEERVMVLRLLKTPDLDLDAALSAEWREGDLW